MQQRNQAGSNDNGGGDVLSNQILSKISSLQAILLTVCVCVCMRVCMCACVQVCMHACLFVLTMVVLCFVVGYTLPFGELASEGTCYLLTVQNWC